MFKNDYDVRHRRLVRSTWAPCRDVAQFVDIGQFKDQRYPDNHGKNSNNKNDITKKPEESVQSEALKRSVSSGVILINMSSLRSFNNRLLSASSLA